MKTITITSGITQAQQLQAIISDQFHGFSPRWLSSNEVLLKIDISTDTEETEMFIENTIPGMLEFAGLTEFQIET